MAILNPNYAFLEADYRNPNLGGNAFVEEMEPKKSWRYGGVFSGIGTYILTPVHAFASDGTFERIHEVVMNAFDYGVVLVIIFAAANWVLGHRKQAIEHLIGTACGYILASHAIDLRDWLKTI
ncbi:glycosyltransferase [Rummeliibacillus sp. JY-2-4R]